jgi:hypothetical protein
MFSNALTPDTSGNYFMGTNSQLWIGYYVLTTALPTLAVATLTVAAAAIAGATTLSVAALPRAILKNQTIVNAANNQAFTLDANAAAGATSITVKPLKTAIAINASFPYTLYLPYYSVAEADLKFDGESVDFRNFGANDNIISAKTKIKVTMSLSGYVVRNDPSMSNLIKMLTEPGNWGQFQYIQTDGVGFSFDANVISGSFASKTDDPLMRSFDLAVSSDVIVQNFLQR